MIYKTFGKTGEKISAIGMGTYYDPLWIAGSIFKIKSNSKLHIDAIRKGIENGINLIDTAEIYGTETLVSKAIKELERDKLFIATKVFFNHLSGEKVKRSCERSLKRLGLKYIDLYQIHFPSSTVRIQETLGAMEELVDQGKIRYIGISNFDLKRTEDAVSSMKRHEIVSTQMPYNILNRKIESGLKQYCDKNNMAILAYYPLAHGKITGKRTQVDPVIREISERHRAPMTHIAIQWLLGRGENVFPIPRASNPAHVEENSRFQELELDAGDMEKLEKIHQ